MEFTGSCEFGNVEFDSVWWVLRACFLHDCNNRGLVSAENDM